MWGRRPAEPGRVVGRAGAGLENSSGWAQNADVARIGMAGELRTAAVLTRVAHECGVTVLHDLRIPRPGVTANVDHVVVSGRRVFLIDSKVWRPGFYWTLRGRTWRGLERFAPADKKTMVMATDAFTSYLTSRVRGVQLPTPILVVWPSRSSGRFTSWLLQVPGAAVITGEALTQRWSRLFGRKPADPRIVDALVPLVCDLGGALAREAA